MTTHDTPLTLARAQEVAQATGLGTVDRDGVDPPLWQIDTDGSIEAHEPMTEAALIEYLVDHAVYPESPTTPQAVACHRVRANIASLIEWLEIEMDKLTDAEITWATVGSLEHVSENLVSVLESISGTDRDDIQRGLDELHG